MKKLNKWFIKMDMLLIMLVMIGLLVVVGCLETNPVLSSLISGFTIPLYYYLFQIMLQSRQKNNFFNIDINLLYGVENEIVWRSPSDIMTEDISYLRVNNIGKIDVFQLYLKIIKHDGAVGWFEIDEDLNTGSACILKIPYKIETIKEIDITCKMQAETRTRKFCGCQSRHGNEVIFSKIERYEGEKYAVYHEKGFDVFEKLERFWI